MASTTARTTNIIAVCPQNDLDAIRLNIRPFPHGMRFPTPSRPKAPRACTHKSRLVTAKCQCPLWSTLRTQVGYIPRSEKCQNRIRAPQLSITLSGWASTLPGISLISSAQAQAVACVRRSALLVRSQHPSHSRRSASEKSVSRYD
jgi:hypothetical protein